MDRRSEIVLRVRVLPGALLRRRDATARDRVPPVRRRPSALRAFRCEHGARFRFWDRWPGPTPLPPAAAAWTAQGAVRRSGPAAGRREPARVRSSVPGSAAPARGGIARNLLSSEQGPQHRHGRGRPRDAPAAAAAGAAVHMKLEITHSTRFRYSGPIAETVMEVRLRPMDGLGQRCLEFELDVSAGIEPRSYRDGYGNNVHYFNLVRPHSRLAVISRLVVETGGERESDPGEELVQDFLRFRSPVKDVEGVRELARRHPIADPGSPAAVESALDELTMTISREFAYDRAVTNVYSAVDEVLALRAGVCQDFAHLFIAVARVMGVPARYVSGYIHNPGGAGLA